MCLAPRAFWRWCSLFGIIGFLVFATQATASEVTSGSRLEELKKLTLPAVDRWQKALSRDSAEFHVISACNVMSGVRALNRDRAALLPAMACLGFQMEAAKDLEAKRLAKDAEFLRTVSEIYEIVQAQWLDLGMKESRVRILSDLSGAKEREVLLRSIQKNRAQLRGQMELLRDVIFEVGAQVEGDLDGRLLGLRLALQERRCDWIAKRLESDTQNYAQLTPYSRFADKMCAQLKAPSCQKAGPWATEDVLEPGVRGFWRLNQVWLRNMIAVQCALTAKEAPSGIVRYPSKAGAKPMSHLERAKNARKTLLLLPNVHEQPLSSLYNRSVPKGSHDNVHLLKVQSVLRCQAGENPSLDKALRRQIKRSSAVTDPRALADFSWARLTALWILMETQGSASGDVSMVRTTLEKDQAVWVETMAATADRIFDLVIDNDRCSAPQMTEFCDGLRALKKKLPAELVGRVVTWLKEPSQAAIADQLVDLVVLVLGHLEPAATARSVDYVAQRFDRFLVRKEIFGPFLDQVQVKLKSKERDAAQFVLSLVDGLFQVDTERSHIEWDVSWADALMLGAVLANRVQGASGLARYQEVAARMLDDAMKASDREQTLQRAHTLALIRRLGGPVTKREPVHDRLDKAWAALVEASHSGFIPRDMADLCVLRQILRPQGLSDAVYSCLYLNPGAASAVMVATAWDQQNGRGGPAFGRLRMMRLVRDLAGWGDDNMKILYLRRAARLSDHAGNAPVRDQLVEEANKLERVESEPKPDAKPGLIERVTRRVTRFVNETKIKPTLLKTRVGAVIHELVRVFGATTGDLMDKIPGLYRTGLADFNLQLGVNGKGQPSVSIKLSGVRNVIAMDEDWLQKGLEEPQE